jgi:hypothetical protein
MLFKIVNENRGNGDFRTLGDTAGRQHIYTWRPEYGAYCYEPKTQEECDSISASNWQFGNVPWKVAPIYDGRAPGAMGAGLVPDAAGRPQVAPTVKIPPYVARHLYENYPIADLLLLCADSGFTPKGNLESTENVLWQLDAAYVGRAWAQEEVKRLRDENAALKLELLAKAAEAAPDIPALATPPAAPRAYTGAKRGPKPKNRASELVEV